MADNQFINFNSQDVADMYRRNQYARMLQEQANAPIERPSYKGIEAPLHATQGVAKLTAALLAGYQQNQMDESYAKEKADAEQKVVAERERSNQAYTDFQAGIAPKPGFGASGSVGDYGGQEMPSQARSDSERLAHLLSSMGSADERVSRSAKNYLDYDATQAQEKARAAKDEITRKDKEAETKRLQDNADRTYNLQLESLKQGRNKQPTAPAGYRYKPNGEQEPIPGGPADVKQSAEFLKKKADANDVLSLLDRADVLLPNSTGSVIGTGVDAAAGAFGYATPGAKAAQQLKMLQGALIAKMPKMSGPQSDKDVELYRQQVGEIGNSNLPIETRQSASLGLRQLQEKYADAPASRTPATTAPATTKKGATVSNWNK